MNASLCMQYISLYVLVAMAMNDYCNVDSLEPTLPAHAATSPPTTPSAKGEIIYDLRHH